MYSYVSLQRHGASIWQAPLIWPNTLSKKFPIVISTFNFRALLDTSLLARYFRHTCFCLIPVKGFKSRDYTELFLEIVCLSRDYWITKREWWWELLMWCCMRTENGLTLLLDAESYDYAFSPQTGEGFKLAVHSHMDQPIMALADIDLSPGFVTQLSVTPILR